MFPWAFSVILSIVGGKTALCADLSLPHLDVTMVPADITMDTCSMDPCPAAQDCVNVAGLGFLCRCPGNFVGATCSTECKRQKADFAFLLDSSDSLTLTDWYSTLYTVSVMILQLQVDEGVHRISIITFGDTATVEFDLDTYTTREDILARVRDLPFREEKTNTSGALWKMRSEIFRNMTDAVPIGILITDGASTVDEHLTIPEALRAKEAGIVMFTIGVRSEINQEELQSIASYPTSRHFYKVSDYGMLSQITNTILEKTCEVVPHYVLGPVGMTGLDGLSGFTGPSGHIGDVGESGQYGPRGFRGSPGDIGLKGEQGPSGMIGRMGPVGQHGDIGETGATGEMGLRGNIGDPGYPGMSQTGATGSHGLPGHVGWRGYDGSTGRMGTSGVVGHQGTGGIQGLPGEYGKTGHPGEMGRKGNKGNNGTVGHPGQHGAVGPLGYIYEDANECTLNVSVCQHVCVNKRQGYECLCHPGYRLDDNGHTCHDIDECRVHNGHCEQFCHNSQGSFSCSCATGHTLSLDMKTCMDVDECCTSLGPSPCHKTHTCINTLGSYACVHEALIITHEDQPAAPVLKTPLAGQSGVTRSVFLRRGIVIGLLLWLGVLTVLTLLCVIVASTLQTPKDPVMRIMEAEIVPEVSRLSHVQAGSGAGGGEQRVFPRMNLSRTAAGDNAMGGQDEIHVAVPSSPRDRHLQGTRAIVP